MSLKEMTKKYNTIAYESKCYFYTKDRLLIDILERQKRSK